MGDCPGHWLMNTRPHTEVPFHRQRDFPPSVPSGASSRRRYGRLSGRTEKSSGVVVRGCNEMTAYLALPALKCIDGVGEFAAVSGSGSGSGYGTRERAGAGASSRPLIALAGPLEAR